MELTEVSSSLDNISLPVDQKKAILQLIDVKINNDMREVIAEIRKLEARMQVMEDKIQLVHDKLSNEIKVVYWVVGIAMSVIIFMVSRK